MSKSKTYYKTTETIANLEKLLEKISKLENKIATNKEDNYFFRGQANSGWQLISSWRRSWRSEFKNINKMNDSQIITMFYKNDELIKSYGYHKKTSLEILSEMQHNNIPTFLIDFTSDIYHALWFAFSDNSPKARKSKYVKIFILNNKTNKVENKLDFNMLIKEKVFPNTVFKAPMSTKRGITQKSYFICDKKKKNFDIECWRIKKNAENTKKILAYLFRKGITARTIYPDLLGAYIDTTRNSSAHYFFKGWLSNDTDKSIEYYSNAIEIDGAKEAYNNRGRLYRDKKKDLNKAIDDFNKAIMMDSSKLFADPYMSRGITYGLKGNLDKAIDDFNRVIKINDKYNYIYLNRGIAYEKKGEWFNAIQDYKKAIEIDDENIHAYAHLYNTFVKTINATNLHNNEKTKILKHMSELAKNLLIGANIKNNEIIKELIQQIETIIKRNKN